MTCDRSAVSPGTPASSTNKTDRHDITEILLKVALNIVNQAIVGFKKKSRLIRNIESHVWIVDLLYLNLNILYLIHFNAGDALMCLIINKMKIEFKAFPIGVNC